MIASGPLEKKNHPMKKVNEQNLFHQSLKEFGGVINHLNIFLAH